MPTTNLSNNLAEINYARAFLLSAATRRDLAPGTAEYLRKLADHLATRQAYLPQETPGLLRSSVAREARRLFRGVLVLVDGDENWIV